MQHVNFEKIVKSERSREKQVYDEFMPKGRKLNKRDRLADRNVKRQHADALLRNDMLNTRLEKTMQEVV